MKDFLKAFLKAIGDWFAPVFLRYLILVLVGGGGTLIFILKHYFLKNPLCLIIFFLSLFIILFISWEWKRCVKKVIVATHSSVSQEFLNKIIRKEVIPYLKKNRRIEIYEANLQTTSPKEILEADKELARLSEDKNNYTIHWTMIVLKDKLDNEKDEWIEKWINEIAERNPKIKETLNFYVIEKDISNLLLPNFYAVPELNIVYIGFGDYSNMKVDGGGILIRKKQAANEVKNLIDGWEIKWQESKVDLRKGYKRKKE